MNSVGKTQKNAARLNRSKSSKGASDLKIIPEVTEGLRKLGRFSTRIINRLKQKEETADFNFTTDFKEEKCSIIWRIENIHRCMLKCGEFLESPTFTTRFGSEIKWVLRLYPKGRRHPTAKLCDSSCGAVGLFIHIISDNYLVTSPMRFRFSYKRDLLNSSSELDCACLYRDEDTVDIEMDLKNEIFEEYYSEYGTDNLFCIQSLKLPQTLLVKCDMYATYAYNKGASANYMPDLSNNSLNKDLKELYKSGKFSDIILQAKDVKFPAHKAILAIRSEAFSIMFQPNLKESSVVQLYIEPEVMANMLQYIYTGSIDNFNIDKAMSLYPVADKYLLHELKDWCVNVMLDNLRMENVCKIAVLVDSHPNPKLKAATLSMFRNNSADIFKKKEWLDLVQDPNRHALVSDILQAVSQDFTTTCHNMR